MTMKQEDIPIDGAWHEVTFGPILHVNFQRKNFVTVWWDSRDTHPWVRWLRVFTDQAPLPPVAVYVGSALDHRGQGAIHHLFRTDYWGAHNEEPPPSERKKERPHQNKSLG